MKNIVHWNRLVLTTALVRRMLNISLQRFRQAVIQAAGSLQLSVEGFGCPVPTPGNKELQLL